jgi:hypothetical protein
VYLAQLTEIVDNAARAAALATGTTVKIDHYGKDRDGIGVGSLNEVAFGYMKKYGATGATPEPGKPQGYEETGASRARFPVSASQRNHPTRRIIPMRWSRTRSLRSVIKASSSMHRQWRRSCSTLRRAPTTAPPEARVRHYQDASRRVSRRSAEDVRRTEGGRAITGDGRGRKLSFVPRPSPLVRRHTAVIAGSVAFSARRIAARW